MPLLSRRLLLCALLCFATTTLAQTPDALAKIIQHQLSTTDDAVLRTTYERRQYAPCWLRQNAPTPQALQLLTVLRDADAYGLRNADYQGDALAEQLVKLSDGNTADADWAQFDVALSSVAVRFIKHLHYGRVDPRSAGFRLYSARNDIDIAARLAAVATTPDMNATLREIEPPFDHYDLLKRALARYRLLAVDAELTKLPSFNARSIKPGEQYAGAAALRRLLVAEGDLSKDQVAADTDTSLDPALVAAIQHYQTRHGLQADGALGKQTFIALTTPFTSRVRQIELTMERWRWFPALHAPPIVVNIPEFRLFALHTTHDREADMLRMDVIVGRTYPAMRTPIFMGDLKYVVFRPYWDVPRSIVVNEILKSIQTHPDYLEKNHFELVRGQRDDSPVVPPTPENIAALRAGQLRLRQQPGPDNPLGPVKFLLPNDYNVYLHGTPAQHYFSASQRTFSHGCIRVSDPLSLAEYVLRNAGGDWSREHIEAAMNGDLNQRITLNRSIPVMIVYGTVMANEAGDVLFFNDIYGYDQKLESLLGLAPVITKTLGG